MAFSKSGRKYYHNEIDKTNVWEKPTCEATTGGFPLYISFNAPAASTKPSNVVACREGHTPEMTPTWPLNPKHLFLCSEMC